MLISNASFALTMPLITHLWTQTFDDLASGLKANQTTPCAYDRHAYLLRSSIHMNKIAQFAPDSGSIYDTFVGRGRYRYCVQPKTALKASGSPHVLKPSLRFRVKATCGVSTGQSNASASVIVSAFDAKADAVGRQLAELPLSASPGCVDGWLEGTTASLASVIGDGPAMPEFVVASVRNTGRKVLGTLTLDALYKGDGQLHRPLQ